MAYEQFTGLLTSAHFPFVSGLLQRTIIVPAIDLPPKAPRSYTGDTDSYNPELPQHFYCQNVLPTHEGLMSVGYSQVIPALDGVAADFDQCITLRDADENNFLLSPARGKNYVYRKDVGNWVSTDPFVGWPADKKLVSRAYVNGRTFVHYENLKTIEYDVAGSAFDDIVYTGINGADIDVIGASNNYLLAAIGIEIHWSSLIDPVDFTPNVQTGAGFAIPQDIKGKVRAIIPIAGGFVIYTTKNAVVALYTNNARAPFVFREITNAGGIIGPEQVSIEASQGFHYGWTTNGLQKINVNSADSLFTAAADFLAGRIWEEFDLATNTFTVERLNENLEVKLTYVSGRFLVVSYGKPTVLPQLYTHAIVYDLSLKRWGKLRKDHVDCFLYPYPNFLGDISDIPPKLGIGLLDRFGQVDLLLMDYRERQNQGVLLLGRYQLVRQKAMTFQTVELEGTHQAYPMNVYLVRSLNGRDNEAVQPLTVLQSSPTMVKYGAPASGSRTGLSISLLITGTFELSTALFTTTRHGNR